MRKMSIGSTNLFLIDELGPEDVAMLQALYSRSGESVETHLDKVEKSGSGKFMEKFYVGYNHKSIADCGSTTLFIEDVSILADKAIQDWPLYSGQETSTRYIDMSKRRVVDPINSSASAAVIAGWVEFYTRSQAAVAAHIREKYPRREAEDEKAYEGAVKARTFDVLRGFLPAGITTQLSWHTNLRQAGDHLSVLTLHPLPEVRDVARGLRSLLAERYPSSGFSSSAAGVSGVSGKHDENNVRRLWEAVAAEETTYLNPHASLIDSDLWLSAPLKRGDVYMTSTLPFEVNGISLLRNRPRGAVAPYSFANLGQIHFDFWLDYGSFRDIQRHRNGVIRMPLLGLDSFEEWYFTELGPLGQEARDLVQSQVEAVKKLTDDPLTRQYYTALGFRVPCRVTWGLPAALYVMELRSTKYVHPTLRSKVQKMVKLFRERFPNIALHADEDPDDWTVRRGTQTITERK